MYFQILFTIALMYFVVRKARVELKKTVETPELLLENNLSDVVIHNDAGVYKNHSQTNGFAERSRRKSENW